MNVAFLDRDGTLLWEPPETERIDSLAKFRILPGVVEGLAALRNRGFTLVMVSNQDGLGTAAYPQAAYDAVQAELVDQLENRGISLSKVFICPHVAEERCPCRKPRTGLVDDFLRREPVDLASSLMIGDRETDGAFAANVGVRFVRMETNGRFPRFASLRRTTKETDVSVFLNVDGSGSTEISTGIGFFDHMLELLAKHSLLDLSLRCQGDLPVDEHHTVEDTGLASAARWPRPSATNEASNATDSCYPWTSRSPKWRSTCPAAPVSSSPAASAANTSANCPRNSSPISSSRLPNRSAAACT